MTVGEGKTVILKTRMTVGEGKTVIGSQRDFLT